MQLSRVLMVLSAAAATVAVPTTSTDETALVESIIAKYNLTDFDSVVAPEIEARAGENCYGGGITFSDARAYALDRAGRWCSGNGGAERYRQGQTKYGCYNLINSRSNDRVEFWIQNLQDRDIDLSSGACFRFLRGVINACSRGGTNGNGAWNWRADPNAGKC